MEGTRVYLDAVRREDLPRFTQWFSDPALLSLLSLGAVIPVSEEDEEVWYADLRRAQENGRAYTFAIRLRGSEQLIGSAGLTDISAKNRSATFGIAIGDAAARGKHYGQEATELVLRYGFDELNLHRIQLYVFAFNSRAIAMYKRVGFQEEGRRREVLFRDGRYHDELMMAILEPEFRSRTAAGRGLIPPDAVVRREPPSAERGGPAVPTPHGPDGTGDVEPPSGEQTRRPA